MANAGSFFKNPIIDLSLLNDIKKSFPDLKYFLEVDKAKIPAAWLIDQCGLKGKRLGPVGVYEKQALIIVNYGGAKQKDVLSLMELIQKSVKDKFKIDLEPEINILS